MCVRGMYFRMTAEVADVRVAVRVHRVHHRACAKEEAGLEERVRERRGRSRRRTRRTPTAANMKPS
jgi:hypothetical protein